MLTSLFAIENSPFPEAMQADTSFCRAFLAGTVGTAAGKVRPEGSFCCLDCALHLSVASLYETDILPQAFGVIAGCPLWAFTPSHAASFGDNFATCGWLLERSPLNSPCMLLPAEERTKRGFGEGSHCSFQDLPAGCHFRDRKSSREVNTKHFKSNCSV